MSDGLHYFLLLLPFVLHRAMVLSALEGDSDDELIGATTATVSLPSGTHALYVLIADEARARFELLQ